MANKVTLKTLEALLSEVDSAYYNKHRVISNIQNDQVRSIIRQNSAFSVKHGIAALGIAAGFGGAGAVGVGLGAAGLVAGGAAAVGGAAAGGVAAGAGSGVAMGLIGGSSAALGGATVGATAGSVVPIVGTAIGAGVGLLVGCLVGGATIKREKNKRECLYQVAIAKQNGQIKALVHEVQELKEANSQLREDNERLEYLLGVLSSYTEVRAALAA